MPKTPGTDTEHRDEAVRVLQDIFARAMRQGSADHLDPEFRAEIAGVVDSIIAAAKPGNQGAAASSASSEPFTVGGQSLPVKDESLGEKIRDVVEDVEGIIDTGFSEAARKATKRKPH